LIYLLFCSAKLILTLLPTLLAIATLLLLLVGIIATLLLLVRIIATLITLLVGILLIRHTNTSLDLKWNVLVSALKLLGSFFRAALFTCVTSSAHTKEE
jgi:hypothetical protein